MYHLSMRIQIVSSVHGSNHFNDHCSSDVLAVPNVVLLFARKLIEYLELIEPISERLGNGLPCDHKRTLYFGHTHAADLTHSTDRLASTHPFSGWTCIYVCETNTVPSFP